MNIRELMTRPVQVCSPNDSLSHAAQLMWENDCGAIPVVDGEGKLSAMITDRDICMAGYTQGRLLTDIPVSTAASRQVFSVGENDGIASAEELMRQHRVRRVPVVDAEGRPVGIISMNDLARHAHLTRRKGDSLGSDNIVKTLAAICEPGAAQVAA